MAYITREDGEHFVIPSYRDVLTARNQSQLKKDILQLSQSYGEYITLQKKGNNQYEIAFSSETGYLLGETVWHFFKRPLDMIYCEVIPNTVEALVVIVKSGSVYLDGSFPLESIPEELVIFLTQQNQFEIYTYGDVPISQTVTEGKFTFDPSSVKSFTVLDQPAFPQLPLLKSYQLQLVNQVLRAQGIGVFPTRQVVIALALAGLLWVGYKYLTRAKPVVRAEVAAINPYQAFNTALHSPAPDLEIKSVLQALNQLFSIQGWYPVAMTYTQGKLTVSVKSAGGDLESLFTWAKTNAIKPIITTQGINLEMTVSNVNRPFPNKIYPLKDVIAKFVDDLAHIYPGNHLKLSAITNKGSYGIISVTLNIDQNVTPAILALIANALRDLPFNLKKMDLEITNGTFVGTINLEALGAPL